MLDVLDVFDEGGEATGNCVILEVDVMIGGNLQRIKTRRG